VTPFTINQYYDPQVEFLELGVSYDNQTTWKLYGPDLDGQYGGLNGTGGLDGVSPYLSLFNPVISDVRGNILAEVTNGVVVWNTSRPTGYGAQPGFQPVALGHGADVAQSSAWRGRWLDITGYYNIGLRPYNPVAGNWLSYDSTWNERDPNYLTFSGDDPINFFDPDGRCRTPLEGLDRMLSPYNFPGTPGTGYSLGAFNQIAGNDPSAYDEFDQMFARNIANGTSMYPYGYLGPEALQEAVNRGYVNDWDLPLIYSQDSHGTFVFKTGGQVVQDAFLAITTSAFLGAVTAEGSQAIESTIESTSRGAQPVFWSGGQTAEAAARTFANANNGIVIGDTVAGQELSAATEGVPWSQARPQWLQLSQNFANTASGEVNVFQNSQGVFLNSIWRDEYQTLINNPNVTGINFHVVMPNGSVVPVH
jgi:RHS repeat-associated protein